MLEFRNVFITRKDLKITEIVHSTRKEHDMRDLLTILMSGVTIAGFLADPIIFTIASLLLFVIGIGVVFFNNRN